MIKYSIPCEVVCYRRGNKEETQTYRGDINANDLTQFLQEGTDWIGIAAPQNNIKLQRIIIKYIFEDKSDSLVLIYERGSTLIQETQTQKIEA